VLNWLDELPGLTERRIAGDVAMEIRQMLYETPSRGLDAAKSAD
jgi:hypothetical protein